MYPEVRRVYGSCVCLCVRVWTVRVKEGYICRNAAAAGAKKIILGNIIYSTYVVLYNESEYQKIIKKYEIILPLKTFT